MKRIVADLHIHSALSPCGADEMTPPAIVARAREKGLDMIAVCDHNAVGNLEATQQAAAGVLTVIAGVEITTCEEVHVLGLFPDAARASAAAETVRSGLPEARRADELFGEQLLMDAHGRVVGRDMKVLTVGADLDLTAAVRLIHRHGGVAIASHVDRPAFGVIGQLGLFPREAGFDAVELSAAGERLGRRAEFAGLALPVLVSSDSHSLEEIGSGATVFEVEAATFAEVVLALRGAARRRVSHARAFSAHPGLD